MVDGGGLENRCTGNRIGGSNPSPSAKFLNIYSDNCAVRVTNPHKSPQKFTSLRASPSLVAKGIWLRIPGDYPILAGWQGTHRLANASR